MVTTSAMLMSDITAMARDVQGTWNCLVKRMSAALLLLKGEPGQLSSAWISILVAMRLGSDVGLRSSIEGGAKRWQLTGKADDLRHWVQQTGKAISMGRVGKIVDSPAVQNSGGLIALATLILNVANANNYLTQARALDGMDQQRVNDTLTATLYAAAAQTAVVDVQLRKGLGCEKLKFFSAQAATQTVFGALIGGFSAVAAFAEMKSLQTQLENAHGSIDPWMEMRSFVVTGQIGAYGAHFVLGGFHTMRTILGLNTMEAAVAGYLLWMGPITWLMMGLGFLYYISCWNQQTPLQNFLSYCCWSKPRASNLAPISASARQNELKRLFDMLYAPRVNFTKGNDSSPSELRPGALGADVNSDLSIDLPSADPLTAYLELSLIGNPVDVKDEQVMSRYHRPGSFSPPVPSWKWLPIG